MAEKQSKISSKVLQQVPKKPSVFSILTPYKRMIIGLVILAIIANALTLFLPKLVSGVIDSFIKGNFSSTKLIWEYGSFAFGIFFFTYLQSILQTYASE